MVMAFICFFLLPCVYNTYHVRGKSSSRSASSGDATGVHGGNISKKLFCISRGDVIVADLAFP